MQLMSLGCSDQAIELLQTEVARHPNHGTAWKLLGMALQEEQREPEAVSALHRARALAPDDRDVALALAQGCLHAGYPAVRPFVDAMQLDPRNLDLLRGYALAVAAGGDVAEATRTLSAALADYPEWIAGHKLLASLRYTAGDAHSFCDAYASACAAMPDNQALYLAWFYSVAQVRDWDQVKAIIDAGICQFGENAQWLLAQLFVASETGDDTAAERLFARTASVDDPGRDLALVRFSLRRRDYRLAENICQARTQTASANLFWPYLSSLWRLTGDERLDWLDRDGDLVGTQQITLSATEYEALAQRLYSLHGASNPYAGQSVRGGTQTDQNLFLRHEPEIRDLRDQVRGALRRYVEKLPQQAAGHPFLGHDRAEVLRGRIHFSGSWSVRLRAGGRNVPHTHPQGWISAVLYVSLPTAQQRGTAPAGWLQFGTPPAELNLPLEASGRVEPVVGRVVFFPSTLWHSTVPFDAGERLVVAFDVKPPRRKPETL